MRAPETFECAKCGEERPVAQRELVGGLEHWCTSCVDHFDLPDDEED
jgi:hypothetical protein